MGTQRGHVRELAAKASSRSKYQAPVPHLKAPRPLPPSHLSCQHASQQLPSTTREIIRPSCRGTCVPISGVEESLSAVTVGRRVLQPRILKSVSIGLQHVQDCPGCNNIVCRRMYALLRNVRDHKSRCTKSPSTCGACQMWDFTVNVHQRLTSTDPQ
jgi:hypothetical protein